MGKFDGVLIASDFDDTLCNSDDLVSRENYKAIAGFIAEGGRFTVATGRAKRTFLPCLHMAPINAPVILSNGASLYDFAADRAVLETCLPDRAAEDIAELLTAFPALAIEAYHGEDIYVCRPNRITGLHMARVGTGYTLCSSPAEMPRPWTKVIVEGEPPILLGAQRYFRRLYGASYEVIFSNPVLLEITAKGSTKGGMVQRLAELLGIRGEHVYCIGDNQNDLPMLHVARVGFCPANASPEVLASGFRVLPSCDDHCIREMIRVVGTFY